MGKLTRSTYIICPTYRHILGVCTVRTIYITTLINTCLQAGCHIYTIMTMSPTYGSFSRFYLIHIYIYDRVNRRDGSTKKIGAFSISK